MLKQIALAFVSAVGIALYVGASTQAAAPEAANPQAPAQVFIMTPLGAPFEIQPARVLAAAGSPAVVEYVATNLTNDTVESFRVAALVFRPDGHADGARAERAGRSLRPRAVEHFAIVLTGFHIDPGTRVVLAPIDAESSTNQWHVALQDVVAAAMSNVAAALAGSNTQVFSPAAGCPFSCGEERDACRQLCGRCGVQEFLCDLHNCVTDCKCYKC